MLRISMILWCLLLLHSPDGGDLWIESGAVAVIKRGLPAYHDHITKQANTIIYTSNGKAFSLRETDAQVAALLKTGC
jgi:hypothetical protein